MPETDFLKDPVNDFLTMFIYLRKLKKEYDFMETLALWPH